MAGSSYGTIFRITTWGESHGKGIGVVVDGCPAGLPLSEEDIQRYLDRRKPGRAISESRQRSSPVYLREKQRVRPLPWRYAIKIRDPRTMGRSWISTGRATRTIPLIRNTGFGITGRRPFLRQGDGRPGGSRGSCGEASGEPGSEGARLYPAPSGRLCIFNPARMDLAERDKKPPLYAGCPGSPEAEGVSGNTYGGEGLFGRRGGVRYRGDAGRYRRARV